MKIRIKNIDKNPIWALPEAKLFLSCEQNEFVDVDYIKLPVKLQGILYNAIRFAVLEAENHQDFMSLFEQRLQPKPVVQPVEQQTVPELKPIKKTDVIEDAQKALKKLDKAKGLKELLNLGANSLKRELPSLGAEDLEMLFRLENAGKKRKTVITLIQDVAAKKAKSAIKKLDSEPKEKVSSVVTSEFEDVIIKIVD